MKTIKLNPSWAWAGEILIDSCIHGTDETVKQHAKQELMRALRGYDRLLKEHTDYFDMVEIDDED